MGFKHIDEKITNDSKNGPFLAIGFGYQVNAGRVTCILPYAGETIRNMFVEQKEKGMTLNATKGRKRLSVILLDNGWIIASAFKPETIVSRQL
jgi:regulator of extracellular matrix RemA (YlzA/DUF370 family)